jgi:hypothetical protein
VYVPYLLPDYAPAPAVAWLVFGAMLAATLALTAGYRTAVSAPLVLGLFLYHYFLQIAVKQSSFDRLIAIYLIALCFADSGRALGLDARRPGGQPTRWAERIVQIQTVSLYLGAALWKFVNPAWHSGELLRSNLLGMWATPLAFELVRLDFAQRTWATLSLSVIALEAAIGVLLLVPRARTLGLLLGIGFHLGNCVVLVIPEFLVAVAAYPAFMREPTLARVATAATTAVARITRRAPRANAA